MAITVTGLDFTTQQNTIAAQVENSRWHSQLNWQITAFDRDCHVVELLAMTNSPTVALYVYTPDAPTTAGNPESKERTTNMAKQWGVGDYRYELAENWPQVDINGVAADVVGDSAGRIYTVVRDPRADGTFIDITPGTGHMLVFDRDGALLETREEGNFSSPHGLWINSDDEIFHADCGHHTVTKYSQSGETLMTLGTKGEPGAPGEPFNMCTRATQSRNGDIWISDGYGQNRVHRFTSNGEHILSFGSGDPVFVQGWRGEEITGTPGTGPGAFNLPHHVMVDDDDNVYVMDRENNRCQIFDIEGNYQREWSDVRGANDAVIDSSGVMHCVSAAGLELRTLDGGLVGRWGEKGEGPGHFTASPHGVFIDEDESLYVAEVGGNNRLQKFVRV